ncbi:hypothetical protein SynBIOSU31_00624 [Synechococcus sp. BIOS-U3-1]|nr:hypothetical protein SynBIOSU31_00624 [Synechococcus sp. BIOS-U3-1]
MAFNGAHAQNEYFSDGTIAIALQQKIEHANFCWCELKVRHGSREVLVLGFPSIANASLL